MTWTLWVQLTRICIFWMNLFEGKAYLPHSYGLKDQPEKCSFGARLLTSRVFLSMVEFLNLFLSLRIHSCKMEIKYVLTSYGFMSNKWRCVNALSRVPHSQRTINVSYFSQYFYPAINGSCSRSAENVKKYIEWSQALELLVFSGWGLRTPNVLSHVGQHCTTKNELSLI